jgi:hypothetical protein
MLRSSNIADPHDSMHQSKKSTISKYAYKYKRTEFKWMETRCYMWLETSLVEEFSPHMRWLTTTNLAVTANIRFHFSCVTSI